MALNIIVEAFGHKVFYLNTPSATIAVRNLLISAIRDGFVGPSGDVVLIDQWSSYILNCRVILHHPVCGQQSCCCHRRSFICS
jgi:hypothetical protein